MWRPLIAPGAAYWRNIGVPAFCLQKVSDFMSPRPFIDLRNTSKIVEVAPNRYIVKIKTWVEQIAKVYEDDSGVDITKFPILTSIHG